MSGIEIKSADRSTIFKFLNGSLNVTVKQGDLSKEVCDAIVNPTNNSMTPNGGLDTILHQKLGEFFSNQVKALSKELKDQTCPVGDSRIFIAKAERDPNSSRFVINTVGPNYASEGTDLAAFHLRECYRTSLSLANTYRLASIAYPAISCGAFKYPPKEAAQVAIEAIRQNSHEVKDVRFVLYERHIYEAFVKEWTEYSDKINREANAIDDRDRDDERFTTMLTELTLTSQPSSPSGVKCTGKQIAVDQNYFGSGCSNSSRSEMFNHFLQLMRIASEKSFTELENVCKLLKPIVRSFALVYTPAQLYDHSIHKRDTVAEHYLQRYCAKEFRSQGMPIHILGDGNCFYNTFVTLFTAGTTTEAATLTPVELRARNVIELVLNLKQYKAKYEALECILDPSDNYVTTEMVHDTNYVSIWDILSIPAVLKIKVVSVYPKVNGEEDLYYIKLNGSQFEPLTNERSAKTSKQEPLPEVWILFSNCNQCFSPLAPSAKSKGWTPNHYVPILKLSLGDKSDTI